MLINKSLLISRSYHPRLETMFLVLLLLLHFIMTNLDAAVDVDDDDDICVAGNVMLGGIFMAHVLTKEDGVPECSKAQSPYFAARVASLLHSIDRANRD